MVYLADSILDGLAIIIRTRVTPAAYTTAHLNETGGSQAGENIAGDL